jgi:hypothetical protein
MKIFIAGIMQGSKTGKGMQDQNYREMISDVIKNKHPNLEIVDPFTLFPDSVEYGDQKAKQVLLSMASEAGSSDLLISYLPEASLGTALEMIRAYDNNRPILCISPLEKNWFIKAVSSKIFINLEEFLIWVRKRGLSEYIDPPSD